ncbi:hypothetical protein RKD30_000021 [Streptomyces pristinaespiralis]
MGSAEVGIEGPGRRGAAHVPRPVVRMADGQPGWRGERSSWSTSPRSTSPGTRVARRASWPRRWEWTARRSGNLAPAEAAGISPGGPPMSETDWSKLIKEWFPGLIDRRLRQVTWPDIDQHRDYIKSLLGTVTVSTIHQRLRDEHKLQVSISSFRRWVHATLPDEVAKSQTDAGRRQAALSGERLRGVPLAAIHNGPLTRAEQTARLVGEQLDGVPCRRSEAAGDYLPSCRHARNCRRRQPTPGSSSFTSSEERGQGPGSRRRHSQSSPGLSSQTNHGTSLSSPTTSSSAGSSEPPSTRRSGGGWASTTPTRP